ncbi:hypothetical protein VNI00_019323 [Paramarasmius palmivorus]|uniref:Uncharacterized protein n=1 Tax=Paramarasmius palmivorus TaxID=297713 RepID=A0AAW0AML9_9AGAR
MTYATIQTVREELAREYEADSDVPGKSRCRGNWLQGLGNHSSSSLRVERNRATATPRRRDE